MFPRRWRGSLGSLLSGGEPTLGGLSEPLPASGFDFPPGFLGGFAFFVTTGVAAGR
jgi:hypothetical protein